MDRRGFLSTLLPLGSALILGVADTALAQVRPRRRRRIRRRIRVRRRIRRHVAVRTIFGRPFWVVPVGLVVGWELAHAGRVVVVKEVKVVEKDGNKIEVATVQDSNGKTEQVEITREDTPENKRDLEGSELPASDMSTPAIEKEEEREEEVDE